MVAAMALEDLPRLQFAVGRVAAVRAAEARWPAQLEQCLSTGFFGAVLFQKFRQTETLLKLNCILCHSVTSCLCYGYDLGANPSQ